MNDNTLPKGKLSGRIDTLPEADYHGAQDFVGSSTLAKLAKSPLHFKYAWENNLVPTESMDIGTFIHRVALEQDIACYVKRPVDANGNLIRSNSKEYKAFCAENEGKRFIRAELYDDAPGILDAIIQHRPFLQMYEKASTEVSYFGIHQATGQKIKARMDVLAHDRSFIVDVKSTARIERFESQIFELGYDVRLMHYAQTLLAVEGGTRLPDFYFLAIESSAPFGCKLFKLSLEDQAAACRTWLQWMMELKACRDDDKWPGYSDEIITARRPYYIKGLEEPNFGSED